MERRFVIETFKSVYEYIDVISSRTPNKVFKDKSLSSTTGSSTFTKTKNWEESVESIRKGFVEGLDNLNKAKGVNPKSTSKVIKNVPTQSVVGFTPHVPNAIAGIPCSMISNKSVKMKTKIISILYDCGAHSEVDAGDFIIAGRNLMDLITQLEIRGYRVQLEILSSFNTSTESAMCKIKIKDYRQPINPLKISYFLIHPSFFRRQAFRWLETTPNLSDVNFTAGYGKPLKFAINEGKESSTDDIRGYLKKHSILDDSTFFTNVYEASRNPADKLASFIKLK